ncbi:glycosyltransferase [Roseovarius sp. EL26]|uniref:glycosyltransferase n=1 Tax=Roseovarius sp. EL26 TaxID=2126672 RepID=UPI000EA09DBC|nr:glycosyltransferase [Roseovarius sp. EL26]
MKKQASPPDQTVRVLISVINYRTAELTMQCVQSVLDDLGDIEGRIAIVDNASGDDSVEKLREWVATLERKAQVSLIESSSNSGFSGGHNQGVSSCEAEYYLILNSDAVLRPGFFKEILNVADENPNTGLFAPSIEYDSGEVQVSCFRFHSPLSELARGAGSGPVSKLVRNHLVALDMPPEPDTIEWASFACIFIRRAVFDTVGLMDEGYFLYFEDTAYCRKARSANWNIKHVQKAVAVHFRGGSGPVKSLAHERKRLPAYYYASRSRMFYQSYGWLGLVGANLCWVLGRVLAFSRVLFGKRIPQANQAEWRDIWINIFSPLGKSYAKKD